MLTKMHIHDMYMSLQSFTLRFSLWYVSSNDYRIMSLLSNPSSPCCRSSTSVLNIVMRNVTRFIQYTDWQKKIYNQNQSCFIPAVISSNYVEINETKITRSIMFWRNLKLCAVEPSNWRKPRPKFDVTDATFEFEFKDDLDTLKD